MNWSGAKSWSEVERSGVDKIKWKNRSRGE